MAGSSRNLSQARLAISCASALVKVYKKSCFPQGKISEITANTQKMVHLSQACSADRL
jgi:hypothetical protein